ncbi:MAG: hypothetical protein L6R42_002776 [Xanthoria sp. 1 TBL-2021]|nr:MAG: hypothetical protein L6R42_002776 [Xanthoria sp. 1 TBL-2021]
MGVFDTTSPNTTRPPLPSIFLPTWILLLLLTTTLPPHLHYLPLPFLTLLTIAAPFYTTGSNLNDYALGYHLIMQLYTYGELCIFNNLHKMKRVEEGGIWTGPAWMVNGKAIGEYGWWERFRMSLSVWGSMRRLGWSNEVKGFGTYDQILSLPPSSLLPFPYLRPPPLPTNQPQSITHWLDLPSASHPSPKPTTILRKTPPHRLPTLHHLTRSLLYLLYIEILLHLRTHTSGPLYPQSTSIPTSTFYPIACTKSLLNLLYVRAIIEFHFHLLASLTIPTGLCIPGDYPDVCAPWYEAYTLRRLWGRTWHQECRSFNVVYGQAVCRRLGLARGSRRSGYIQLVVAFAMTTLSHGFGAVMIREYNAEMGFLMLQPVGIMVEDGVLAVGRKIGVEKGWGWRLLGYVWVAGWFTWSGWQYYDARSEMFYTRSESSWNAMRPNLLEWMLR